MNGSYDAYTRELQEQLKAADELAATYVEGFTQCCGRCGQNIFDEPACIAPPRTRSKPKPSKRKPDMAERIYRALFVTRTRGQRMAMSIVMWPDPKPEIIAAIRAALSEGGE